MSTCICKIWQLTDNTGHCCCSTNIMNLHILLTTFSSVERFFKFIEFNTTEFHFNCQDLMVIQHYKISTKLWWSPMLIRNIVFYILIGEAHNIKLTSSSYQCQLTYFNLYYKTRNEYSHPYTSNMLLLILVLFIIIIIIKIPFYWHLMLLNEIQYYWVTVFFKALMISLMIN